MQPQWKIMKYFALSNNVCGVIALSNSMENLKAVRIFNKACLEIISMNKMKFN